jgi:O-antigen/teichoic acid export membrane protein
MTNTIRIGRKDVVWSYAATFLQIGVGVILLPFILKAFSQETVAIWTIFLTVMTLSNLLDFGFNPSFARNVSYVVSGVTELKKTGHLVVENHTGEIDYGLFKGMINAMRWFYSRAAWLLFFLLATAGTYYMFTILKTYSGNHAEVYIAWAILVILNAYALYTMYYDSLMQGKGLVKRAKQIKVAGQAVYLILAIVLILLRFNLIAVVSAQVLSIVVIRILSYRTIYTAGFKRRLHQVSARPRREILSYIYPNAVKVGLTGVGGFLVLRSSTIIGSLFLSLDEIASYGITMQVIGIISAVGGVYFFTYQPKMVQYRVQNDNIAIKQLYLKGCLLLFGAFLLGGAALLLLGEWALNVIGSQTPLLSGLFMLVALVIGWLEMNHAVAGQVLLTKNEVPFFKAALFAGGLTLVLLFLFLEYTPWGVFALILAPGIAQGCYQNWKWPVKVARELHIKSSDVCGIIKKDKSYD